MSDVRNAQLFDAASWGFAHIATDDVARAERLEGAGSPYILIEAIADAVRAGMQGRVCYGWERAEQNLSHHRAVVQFPVMPALFDWFFNGRSGYRAHFRVSAQHGLAFNAALVRALAAVLQPPLPAVLHIPEIDSGLRALGMVKVGKDQFLRSLDPILSKLWFAVRPLADGRERLISLSGPRLLVCTQTWAAPYMEDPWLDLKGAFTDGSAPLYQPKPADARALRLHETGQA